MGRIFVQGPKGTNISGYYVESTSKVGQAIMNAPKLALDALPKVVQKQVEDLGHDSKIALKRRPADKPVKVGFDKRALPILKAAVKMARDETPDSDFALQQSGPDMSAVRTFLQNRLRPEDFKRLCDMLSGQDPDAYPSEDDDLERETSEREQREETPLATMSNDDPPDFPGMPRKGGTMVPLKKQAADRKGASYADRFPGATVSNSTWTGHAR
jgi:hypothetical protein